ncbi:hypothetical protein ACL9RL_15510 [Plantibacter sp. Mn2098]|uniref:hypothetical protein n=1 Tax=Plantibacter sp. Mn2098 TaxID=3395266 RepID=UPI003BC384A1
MSGAERSAAGAWPPIQIARDEWIVMRAERARPAAVVRRFISAGGTAYFRCVTWAERSEDRRLIGRFRTLAEADAAVPARGPEAQPAQQPTDAWERGATPWDAAPRRTNRYA